MEGHLCLARDSFAFPVSTTFGLSSIDMPALWENTEIGRRLMEAWEGEGSVFIVARSFEIYQELKKLNDPSMCRWLAASAPRGGDEDGGENRDDGDAESISTVQTDGAT